MKVRRHHSIVTAVCSLAVVGDAKRWEILVRISRPARLDAA
jgi:hypothetical protein